MPQPEEQARTKIDQLLTAAGWVLQDRDAFDRNAGVGVAVREFPLMAGPCDYLLFVEGKAAGVIEAKKAGVTLSGVVEQSHRYMANVPEHVARWDDLLIYDYESTGEETFFRSLRDPKPRSRRLFALHRPETLCEWLTQPETLRARLRNMPPLDPRGLRDCQVDAIHGLEASLAEDQPRALIQLATGAGKTFTACSFSYRLIKHAGAKRILFLVDRNNLGDQTLKEFQNFQPVGAANRFTDTYIVQHLHGHRIDPDAKVVITTIQRSRTHRTRPELAVLQYDPCRFPASGMPLDVLLPQNVCRPSCSRCAQATKLVASGGITGPPRERVYGSAVIRLWSWMRHWDRSACGIPVGKHPHNA